MNNFYPFAGFSTFSRNGGNCIAFFLFFIERSHNLKRGKKIRLKRNKLKYLLENKAAYPGFLLPLIFSIFLSFPSLHSWNLKKIKK